MGGAQRPGAQRLICTDMSNGDGAQERTRTSTTFRSLAPEASASTNSATWAFVLCGGPDEMSGAHGREGEFLKPRLFCGQRFRGLNPLCIFGGVESWGVYARFVLVALVPGLRRDERFLGGFSISSAHTGGRRYPADHPQTLAGLFLGPGLRRDERFLGGAQFYPRGAGRCATSISSAHTGEGRYVESRSKCNTLLKASAGVWKSRHFLGMWL